MAESAPSGRKQERPKRLQRRRVKGWRLPPGAKIVDRSSRWGNPFAVREDRARRAEGHDDYFEVYSKATGEHLEWHVTRWKAHRVAVDRYRDWLPDDLRAQLLTLAGLDLACPCEPYLPCHADCLLELANEDRDV
jgi:hypothetical protein